MHFDRDWVSLEVHRLIEQDVRFEHIHAQRQTQGKSQQDCRGSSHFPHGSSLGVMAGALVALTNVSDLDRLDHPSASRVDRGNGTTTKTPSGHAIELRAALPLSGAQIGNSSTSYTAKEQHQPYEAGSIEHDSIYGSPFVFSFASFS